MLFVVAAGLLMALGRHHDVAVSDVVLLVLALAVLGRLDFDFGAGFMSPTQLVFVPMLFVLPPAAVPLAVAGAYAIDRLPAIVTGRWHPQRVLFAFGDAWYSLGPALVFELADLGNPDLGNWGWYVLALVTQFAGDTAGTMCASASATRSRREPCSAPCPKSGWSTCCCRRSGCWPRTRP